MKQIYTSLDIGSDSIKVVVTEYYKQNLNVLSVAEVPSKGIKRGLITEPELALEALNKAIKQTEDILGTEIKEVIANIPSYFAEFSLISAGINIPTDENGNMGTIDGQLAIKVLQAAAKPKVSTSREMITMQPIDFEVDGRRVQDPKGIKANTLKVRAILVETPTKNVQSVIRLCEMAHLEVVDISISAIGDMYSNHHQDMEKQAGIIVNIGAETTTVSYFNKCIVIKNSIINMGGKDIDNDLAYMYRLTMEEAKKLKERFAHAYKRHCDVETFYETKDINGEPVKLNQYQVAEVVQARLEELFNLIGKEIETMNANKIDYFIITGGISNMKDFNLLASDIFGKRVIIENVKTIGVRNNKYSVCLGNIYYFISKLELKGDEYSMFSREEQNELSSIKKNLSGSNENKMLDKVFGYFFNE